MPNTGQKRAMRAKRLFHIQRGACACCGEPMRLKGSQYQPRRATTDEVWPRSRGGMRLLGNQVAMHRSCNEAKADRDPNGCERIWLELVNARLRKRGKIA